MNLIPIDSILISSDRQRKTNRDVSAEFVASVGRRLINPITLRRTESGPMLVAGERRLIGLKTFGLTELEHNVHFRFIEDLDPDDAEIIELEENVKREDLHWRDQIKAVARIHELFTKRGLDNTQIAREISIHRATLSQNLIVFKHLESSNLRDATHWRQAYSILQNIAERRAVSIVQDIAKAGTDVFNFAQTEPEQTNEQSDDPSSGGSEPSSDPSALGTDAPQLQPTGTNGVEPGNLGKPNGRRPDPILNESFLDWIESYSGDKFTLVHCDFPYDVPYASYAKSLTSADAEDEYDFTGFWPLMDALCANVDRLMSYQSHLMFWFSMKFYTETKERLTKAGLYVHDHPFVWHKTDNAGIIPGRDNMYPRRTYETAFLCSRGRRPLVRSLANSFGAPMATGREAIHPSQKPVPVLRHFFGMLIDETTEVFDPTAGSGSAIRCADEMGARRVVGLEIDPNYAAAANGAIQTSRILRGLSG